ncbi:MAG TPA: hypothetical protein VFE47_18735 [Tepidisphaeraceae bacterium]|jgi:predicted transcriptional regulator|nr:hypothetical protein [Tepidisphaeraceae bacterium]
MLTIQLDGQLEERLKLAAERTGDEPQVIAKRVLEENLPRAIDATRALFAKWEREDATTDPVELKRRQKEGDELMRNLDRNRRESEGPQARKLWP